MKICEVDRDMIDPGIRKKVSDFMLKRSAEDLLARLLPIAKALDQMQNDKCTIAEAVDIWKELCGQFRNNKEVEKIVKKRYNQVVTNVHLLANMIHPSLQEKALCEEEVNTALEYANEKYPLLIPTT